MVFKVYKYDKLLCILNENTSTDREVVVNSCCVVQGRAFDTDSDLSEPLLLLVLNSRDLMVLATKFTKDLYNAPFDLQLCFSSHQGRKWHSSEITSHGYLHVFDSLGNLVNFIKFLLESH